MATTLYVCLDSRSAPGMWKAIVEESRGLVVPDGIRWPQPAWAVLRHDNRTGWTGGPRMSGLLFWCGRAGESAVARGGWLTQT